MAAVLSIAVAWGVAGGHRHDWSLPLSYHGDALFSLQMIKRMVEGGWFFETVRQGYPGVSNMLDFPAADSGLYLIQKTLGWVLGDAVAVFNVFYLLGFGAAALSAYWVLRRLLVQPVLAFAGAVLFALAPYHFGRLEHLMLSWYFGVPLLIYQALYVMGALPEADVEGNAVRRERPVMWFTGAFVLGCFGVYYAFFGAMLIFFAGAFSLRRGAGRLGVAVGLIGALLLAVTVNTFPNLIHKRMQGANPEVAVRAPLESEVYGLKISQLLLPAADHRAGALRRITSHYDNTFPLINENRYSGLGLLGAAGFLILMYVLLSNQLAHTRDPLLSALALLLIVILLVATVGGFSSLFAMFVSPMIRAWNRISIFASFISLTALLLWAGRRGWAPSGRIPALLFVLALLGWAVLDQTPRTFSKQVRGGEPGYLSDQSFVRQVEAALPRDSAVLQLPYMSFPESAPLVKMQSYDPGRPYLHSHALKWSFGAIRGREADGVVRKMTEMPVAEMVAAARRQGFAAIYVDRFGYEDAGQAMESALRALLAQEPIVSPDGRLSLFPLRKG